MSGILRVILVAFIAVLGLVINHDISTKAQTLHYLKEDLEIAVHDAALQVNEEALSSGRVVFDQQKALRTFKESFEKNSNLTSSDYELLEVKYMDDSEGDFPVTYQSEVADFKDTFNSPTVLAVIKAKKDSYFSNATNDSYIQVASYSYKVAPTNPDELPEDVIGLPNELGFIWPSPYTDNVTSGFGKRHHPILGIDKLHAGTDIAAAGITGSPVVSVKDGTVLHAGVLGGYGNLVVVDHGDGVETRYAHLSSINLTVGEKIKSGKVVGTVGSTGNSTGPHLHFEVRIEGKPYDPMIFYPNK